jgi:hypothetical protein
VKMVIEFYCQFPKARKNPGVYHINGQKL